MSEVPRCFRIDRDPVVIRRGRPLIERAVADCGEARWRAVAVMQSANSDALDGSDLFPARPEDGCYDSYTNHGRNDVER